MPTKTRVSKTATSRLLPGELVIEGCTGDVFLKTVDKGYVRVHLGYPSLGGTRDLGGSQPSIEGVRAPVGYTVTLEAE